jgi:hypothetical protein
MIAPGLTAWVMSGRKPSQLEEALAAAKNAAERQQLGGQDADITYQRAGGTWATDRSIGGDRPEAYVVDAAKE